ncbi:unnamed protein product [Gongylonema pulchrum]|uniref:KAP NTPase domain-containing protein n=1 Tax=Gongylonema pulchrum TaxID=637853 RepID=A0A183EG93_9BILA|nr:unnamed protein product [Gongylonema pulchrum]
MEILSAATAYRCIWIHIDANFSWNDGRALVALVGKFRPDLIDYISLCAADDPAAAVKAVFTAIRTEYLIEPPCGEELTDWVHTDEETRVAYISAVVEALKDNPQRMREMLVSDIRRSTASHKRKANRQIRMNLSELNDEGDLAQELKSCRRLDKTIYAQTSAVEPTKYWTKRPAVDRLNPERLCAVRYSLFCLLALLS